MQKPPKLRGKENLDDLDERYRRCVIDQLKQLFFPGVCRSGRDVRLSLEEVYVELNVVADAPEAADTFSADEHRMIIEAEARGRGGDADVRMALDTLRAERWRKEGRAAGSRFERRSIEAAIADPRHPCLVVLGDPGPGKTTARR
ncbi:MULTISPECIES: hypothetical protein [Sorangium]|uniref:hypothetical protein n=1 Tax=Sorangium TaxID=39643 RepID=UPI003D9C0878